MKDYNGFTGAQRDRAQKWLNKQWASGSLLKPKICVACGQDHGPIDAHAEDYSEPFRAGVTDGFHLCFICHMMVHCRHRNPTAWTRYRHFVEIGGRARIVGGRNFPAFSALFLSKLMTPGLFDYYDPPLIAVDAAGTATPRRPLFEIELSQDRRSVTAGPGSSALSRV